MTGVLQEPIHSGCSFPYAPGSSCFQTCFPVFLSIAMRKVFSPGPKLRKTRFFQMTGEDALPQICSQTPKSLRHSSLPLRS